ncbi:MAG: hypothetical protein OXI67_09610 [Candidatus Poribacteria bacterium]|nr:hypothetical protein [Candidatus Poribacteria bacterium]
MLSHFGEGYISHYSGVVAATTTTTEWSKEYTRCITKVEAFDGVYIPVLKQRGIDTEE